VRSLALLTTFVIAATSAAACARSHPVTNALEQSAEVAAADTVPVVIEIENHNWSDINVYVIHDGKKNRLTTVTATKDLSLKLPAQYQGETGTFRLVVYRIGGRDSYTTDPISIRTGNTVRLTVESKLAHSSVGVW